MNAYLTSGLNDLWLIAGWTMVHFLWLGALVGVVAAFSRTRAAARIRQCPLPHDDRVPRRARRITIRHRRLAAPKLPSLEGRGRGREFSQPSRNHYRPNSQRNKPSPHPNQSSNYTIKTTR